MLAVFGWDDRDTVRIYPEVGSLNNTNRQLEAGFSGQISITNDIVLRSGDPTLYKRRKEAFIEDFLQLIKASLSENSKPLIFSGESFVLLFSDDQSSQEKSIMYCEFGRFHLKNGSYLPQPLHFPQKISSIACGSSHALVLTEDGSVFSIGRGRFGELGLGENTLSTEGQLRKLDLPFSERVFYIAAGSNHSAVISEPYGYLYTFGCGSHYRLGHDTDDHIYTPRRVEALVGVGDFNASAIPMGIKLVGCGTWHTIAVAKGSNDVFGMGWNKFGQLGTLLDQTGKHAEQIINYPERISQLDDDHLLGDDNHNVVAVTCGSKLSCLLTSSQRLIVMGELGSGPIQGVDDVAIFNLYQSSRVEDRTTKQEDYQTIQLTTRLFSALHPRVIDVNELIDGEKNLRSSKKKRDYEQMIEHLGHPHLTIGGITARESYVAIDIR